MSWCVPVYFIAIVGLLLFVFSLLTGIATCVNYVDGRLNERSAKGAAYSCFFMVIILISLMTWLIKTNASPWEIEKVEYHEVKTIQIGGASEIVHRPVQVIYADGQFKNANLLIGGIVPEGHKIKHTIFKSIYNHIKYQTKEKWEVASNDS